MKFKPVVLRFYTQVIIYLHTTIINVSWKPPDTVVHLSLPDECLIPGKCLSRKGTYDFDTGWSMLKKTLKRKAWAHGIANYSTNFVQLL